MIWGANSLGFGNKSPYQEYLVVGCPAETAQLNQALSGFGEEKHFRSSLYPRQAAALLWDAELLPHLPCGRKAYGEGCGVESFAKCLSPGSTSGTQVPPDLRFLLLIMQYLESRL